MRFWFLVATLVSFFGLAACPQASSRNQNQFVLVLSTGFRGPVYVVEDPINGSDCKYLDGVPTYHIPSDGVFRSKSVAHFIGFLKIRAGFEDGTDLPLGGPDGQCSTTCLHLLSVSQAFPNPFGAPHNSKFITFVVGDREAYQAMMLKIQDGSDLRPENSPTEAESPWLEDGKVFHQKIESGR